MEPFARRLAIYQFFYPFIKVFTLGTKHINADTFCNILTSSRLIIVVMPLFVSFYRLDDTFAGGRIRAVVDEFGISCILQVFFQLFAPFFTTGITLSQILNTAKQKCFKFM